jgi:hypothetical protein
MNIKVWSGNAKKKNRLEDRGINCNNILKHIRKKGGGWGGDGGELNSFSLEYDLAAGFCELDPNSLLSIKHGELLG